MNGRNQPYLDTNGAGFYERCSGSCSHYGECSDCKSWFIPAGQYPCNKCKYLNVKPPK